MNREIKIVLMDRAKRRGLEMLRFALYGTCWSVLWLSEDPMGIGFIATAAGILFCRATFEKHAVGRVYSQLPVGDGVLGRIGLISMWVLALLLFMSMGPVVQTLGYARWLKANPNRWVVMASLTCAFSTAVSLACIFFLGRLAAHRLAPRPVAALRERLGERGIEVLRDFWMIALCSAGGITLSLHGLPALPETIGLFSAALMLSAATWMWLPRASILREPSSRGLAPIPMPSGRGAPIRLSRSPHWTIAWHFWGLAGLMLVPAVWTVARGFLWVASGDSTRTYYQGHFLFAALFFWPLFALAWIPGKTRRVSLRVYRGLPITAEALTNFLMAPSAAVLGCLALLLLWVGGSAPDWAELLGATFALFAVYAFMFANSIYDHGASGGFLFLLFLSIIVLMFVSLAHGISVTAVIYGAIGLSITLAACAPFYLRGVLENRTEPYRPKEADGK